MGPFICMGVYVNSRI